MYILEYIVILLGLVAEFSAGFGRHLFVANFHHVVRQSHRTLTSNWMLVSLQPRIMFWLLSLQVSSSPFFAPCYDSDLPNEVWFLAFRCPADVLWMSHRGGPHDYRLRFQAPQQLGILDIILHVQSEDKLVIRKDALALITRIFRVLSPHP